MDEHGKRSIGRAEGACGAVVGLLVLCVAGCSSPGDTVSLTVLTDFQPVEQFASARYQFDVGDTARPNGVIPAERFASGTEFYSASSGARPFTLERQTYRVELLDAAGEVIASASAESSFVGRGAQAVTLTVTRSDCEGVRACASDETCLCGDCYPIACRADGDAAGCPGACCERAGSCDMPTADCASVECVDPPSGEEGPRCVWVAREGGCAASEWCDPISGCLERTYFPEVDAGTGPIGPDADRDGSPDAIDCADDDPTRRPGATDVYENEIDEDCDGADESCPEVPPDTGLTITTGCAARCCDGTVIAPIQSTDEGDCVRDSSPACNATGFHLQRSSWNGEIVYRRPRYCYALCNNRSGYTRLTSLAGDCAEEGAAHCRESDRGGLRNHIWSQCQPDPPPS